MLSLIHSLCLSASFLSPSLSLIPSSFSVSEKFFISHSEKIGFCGSETLISNRKFFSTRLKGTFSLFLFLKLPKLRENLGSFSFNLSL